MISVIRAVPSECGPENEVLTTTWLHAPVFSVLQKFLLYSPECPNRLHYVGIAVKALDYQQLWILNRLLQSRMSSVSGCRHMPCRAIPCKESRERPPHLMHNSSRTMGHCNKANLRGHRHRRCKSAGELCVTCEQSVQAGPVLSNSELMCFNGILTLSILNV
jgi:hypothetical protein